MDGFRVGTKLSGGGYLSPLRRRKGLAGLGDPSVMVMGSEDVSDFLGRHSDTRSKVNTFANQVAAGGYMQGVSNYAIPEYGIAVSDSVFGNVTIFPDAAGVLRFTGNVPQTVADQTNKPPYVPPAGADPLDPWKKLIEYGPWLLGLGGVLWVVSMLPRRR